MAPKHVAIIGSGLAGPALALSLASRNISSTIYESRLESYHQGGAIALGSNAVRVLDHVGVYQNLRSQGFVFEDIEFANGAGNVLGKLSVGSVKTYGYPALRLRRENVRKELLDKVEEKGIKVVYGKKLVGVDEAEGSVKIRFADGEVVKADLVVGADGIRSAVRGTINPTAKPVYSGVYVIYGMLKRDKLDMKLKKPSLFKGSYMLFGKEGSFTVQPTDAAGNEVAWFVNLSLPDRSREDWEALAKNKEELRRLVVKNFCHGAWPEEVQILCRESPLDEFRTWETHMLPVLTSWKSASGKVILIGDAAHAIPPSAGQGGAMSFEDAESLAITLSTMEKDVDISALQKWEDHRMERLQKILDFTKLAIKIRNPSSNWALEIVREWFIWLLFKFKGPEGYKWIYSYDAAQVKSVL